MSEIETFANEDELLRRIEQLKTEGVMENGITVVADKELAGDALQYTDVNFKAAEGSAWDKIVSWFSDGEPEDRVMSELDLDSEEEVEGYKNELDKGSFLLYVSNRTADPDIYAGNDGSIEKDEFGVSSDIPGDESDESADRKSAPGQESYAVGTTQPVDTEHEEDEAMRNTVDNRTLEDDETGRSEQFVPKTDKEEPLGKREGTYEIDEEVQDDNYGLSEAEWNDLTEAEKEDLREEQLKADETDVRDEEPRK